MKPHTRSPIKRIALNLPGRSLTLRLIELLSKRAVLYAYSISLLCIAAASWLQWAVGGLILPVAYTVAAAAVVILTAAFVRRQESEVRNVELGLDGEREVSDTLQEVSADLGYRVFHSIADDGFDIDHVLIGPAGIFVIETKTHSKRDGDRRVKYDGKRVLIDGREPDRDPIAQVRACSRRIGQILYERLGERVPVRGVVLYPGWFVEEADNAEVLVLAPKRLFSVLKANQPRRPAQDPLIVRMSEALARHIRETKEASLKR